MKTNDAKDAFYCIYCGQEYDKENDIVPHSEECPIVAGVPEMVFGVRQRADDHEHNLSLGRLGTLCTVYPDGTMGPRDRKIRDRLVYEEIAYMIRTIGISQMAYSAKQKKLVSGYLSRRKLKKLDQAMEHARKFANAWDFPMDKFNEILEKEKFLIISSSEKVPVFRNTETGQLIYFPIE